MNIVIKDLLSISQACRVLNVHPDTLRRWEKEGKITSIRVGPRHDRRYKVEAIYSLAGITSPKESIEKFDTIKSESHTKLVNGIKKAKTIIFDLGDTLVEPFPSRGSIFARLAYLYGYNLDPELLETNFHKLYDEWEKEKLLSDFTIHTDESTRENLYSKLNSDVLINSGFPESRRREALKLGDKIYKEVTSNPKNWRIYPGVIDFLNLLKKEGKKLAILDNWNHYLPEFIEKSGLKGYFPIIISAGVLQIRKPDPNIFRYTLEKLDSQPSETIYIGNRFIDDFMGPKSVGITPILYDAKRKYLRDKSMLKFYYYEELMY